MGYFNESFGIGAGLTLGSIAAEGGANLASNYIDAKFQQTYNNYRSQYFDPIVRHDLNELLVFQRLPQLDYPFPGRIVAKRGSFFERHKIYSVMLIACFALALVNMINPDYDSNFFTLYGILSTFVVLGGLKLVIQKIINGGKNKLIQNLKHRLEMDGEHYWHVREYLRQALTRGELNLEQAITKIANTELGKQFPDTTDEIEANAFYYRQKHGLA